jgi:hypothetical protein
MQLGGTLEIVSHIFQFVLPYVIQFDCCFRIPCYFWDGSNKVATLGAAPDGMEDNMTYIEN